MTRRNESCAFFSGVMGGRGGEKDYVGGYGGRPSKNAKNHKPIIFFISNFGPGNLQVGESPDPRTPVKTFKINKNETNCIEKDQRRETDHHAQNKAYDNIPPGQRRESGR